MTIALAVSFLLLAALAGFAAAGGRRWALRLPLLAATPVLALVVWWALQARDGWPAPTSPPDGAALVAGVVDSPRPGYQGAIYLWLQPPGADTPRAYRLAYSPELERQLAGAAHAQKSGARVAVRTARARTGPHGRRLRQRLLRFYRLPRSGTQRKEHQ